uniref:Uncharacterized protein n=1 Tax=Ailuropoda melanoleuca TaxID=9646 RepID=A0A7N5JSF1_AILME
MSVERLFPVWWAWRLPGISSRPGLGLSGKQQQHNHKVGSQARADKFSKHSYQLDLWLVILFEVVFIFVYLVP